MAGPAPQLAHKVLPGRAHPPGATLTASGVNFSLFSEGATGVELLLFEKHDSPRPYQTIAYDPAVNRTFPFWHVLVEGLKAGAHYAYRVDGPHDPAAGHRFNREKVLIDPYALGNTKSLWRRGDACTPLDNVATSMRSVVIDPSGYDWEGDRPLRRPMEDTVIYEMHAAGFTSSPASRTARPGTFKALIEKIPYLKELGVTAVELMPVFDFDETDVVRNANGRPLCNFWGYGTIGFFAPQSAYCVSPEHGRHLDEFRDLVKALHRAGIEVILDVAFNLTGEGNHAGPVICFRGVDNRIYYRDHTGGRNIFNCDHPVAQKLILDSLRYWVKHAHVDGFRFDRGSLPESVAWQTELDEELADTKLIAEGWDPARFPGSRWAEWNGRYRDDVRRFARGEAGLAGAVATRIAGSSDLYQSHGATPVNSINFITCHNGFTMNDLVSYNSKHNEANGEGNRDGIDDNLSWNYGAEGVTSDPEIDAVRLRQIKNFATILMLSRGVPMMLAGDEVRRTQRGNNNAYCQHNELSWFDWDLVESNAGLLRYWKRIIEFRKQHPALRGNAFFSGQRNERGMPDVAWHGCRLNAPGWNDPEARVLAFTLAGFKGDADIHAMINMFWERLDFDVPPLADRYWFIAADTSRECPDDIADPGDELQYFGDTYGVEGRSIAVLVSK
jgi:isoamylase